MRWAGRLGRGPPTVEAAAAAGAALGAGAPANPARRSWRWAVRVPWALRLATRTAAPVVSAAISLCSNRVRAECRASSYAVWFSLFRCLPDRSKRLWRVWHWGAAKARCRLIAQQEDPNLQIALWRGPLRTPLSPHVRASWRGTPLGRPATSSWPLSGSRPAEPSPPSDCSTLSG